MIYSKTAIYITPEEITPTEPQLVKDALACGFDFVHLRHPKASRRDMVNLIESIPQKLHQFLKIHGHFDLASEYAIGGLHLNRRCPTPPAFFSGSLSKSCHSANEIIDAKDFDYVTISPVFNSISKPGYKAAFSRDELKQINEISQINVIALGGITPKHLQQIEELGFAGFAVSGAISDFIKKYS